MNPMIYVMNCILRQITLPGSPSKMIIRLVLISKNCTLPEMFLT